MILHKTHWKISSAETLLAKSHTKTPKVARYCRDVLTGQIPVGRLVFLAVQRHLDDLEHGHKRGLRYDDAAGAGIIEFFERFLNLPEGENGEQARPFLLESWQAFLLAILFGWKGADGFRRFRTAYNEIAKGNGKSPVAAGIGIKGLVADGEPAAEIYSAAVMKDQAKILFRDAEIMVSLSPLLAKRVKSNVNNLSVRKTNSYFRPISSEKRGLDGKRVHIALIDEVHEHPDPIVVNKMRAGTKGRRQALIFEITNSGHDRQTVCYDHHEYSRQVLEGTVENDSWFAFVCHLDACAECAEKGHLQPNADCPKCDSWLDEDVWIKANPNLGVSIQLRYLRELVAEAVAMPAQESIVKRLNFCIWTAGESRAISAQAWAACTGDNAGDPRAWRERQLDLLKGLIAFGGVDLGCTDDLTAFLLYFPKQDKLAKARVLPWFYAPESAVLKRVTADRIPYDVWKDRGFLTVTHGNSTDYQFIREDIKKAAALFQVKEIRFDRYRAIDLVNQLLADGLPMVDHPMGISMHDPTTMVLQSVREASFEHGNNPVLTFNSANLVTIQDAKGNINMKKPGNTNSPFKIDGMVAFALARAAGAANPIPNYDDSGIWRI